MVELSKRVVWVIQSLCWVFIMFPSTAQVNCWVVIQLQNPQSEDVGLVIGVEGNLLSWLVREFQRALMASK